MAGGEPSRPDRGRKAGKPWRAWRAWAPIALAVVVAAAPVPGGLPRHAWYFFAIFIGVVAALVLEPLPNAAAGLVGVAVAVGLSRWVLFSPAQLRNPGFDARVRALDWALMLLLRVVSWQKMASHGPAWDMLMRLALLVTMADGLSRTGFVGWFASGLGRQLSGLPPTAAVAGLVAAYYLSHYLFATTTAHATAVLPVMLSVGLAIPGLPMEAFATLLALSHGIMGVISPYATGPAPVYHGSGYLPSSAFWRLGAVFGAVFLAALLLLGLPAALALWR